MVETIVILAIRIKRIKFFDYFEAKSLLNNIKINIEYTHSCHIILYHSSLFIQSKALVSTAYDSSKIDHFFAHSFIFTYIHSYWKVVEEEAIRQFNCIQAGSCRYNECIKAYMPCTCLADIWNHVDSMVAVNEL